jgi:hypothetical protein
LSSQKGPALATVSNHGRAVTAEPLDQWAAPQLIDFSKVSSIEVGARSATPMPSIGSNMNVINISAKKSELDLAR